MLGKNLILYSGGVAVAASKACSINVQCELMEVSSPNTGAWRTFLAGMKEWSVSCAVLVMAESVVSSALSVGASVEIDVQPLYDEIHTLTGFVAPGDQVLTDTPASAVNGIYMDAAGGRFVTYLGSYGGARYFSTEWPNKEAWTVAPHQHVTYRFPDASVAPYEWSGTAFAVIPRLRGDAIIQQWEASGAVGSLAQGAFSFKGNGALASENSDIIGQ